MMATRYWSRWFLPLVALLLVAGAWFTATMRASDNLDFDLNGQIRDMYWDSRLFDGTAGFPGAILWYHNPAGIPGINQAEFEARLAAGFHAWEAADDGLPGEPLVPVVNFGGQTSVTDAFALDGVNAVVWQADAPGGTLAVTPCWVLTGPTTTIDDGMGNTVLPIDGGSDIPFPGPIGAIYQAGAIIDCGMRFDSADSWSTSEVPDPNGFDVQAIGTHESGHFRGISHSTLGDFTGVGTTSATMLPFGAPGDDTFRTLEQDDIASMLRTYARNHVPSPLSQTLGNRGVIQFNLRKGAVCEAATGLSVVAYPTSTGISGPNGIETFSGSQLRGGILDEPYNGSVTLNVPPLSGGETYTIYARTFEQGTGALSAQRYNYTTINSNLLDLENRSRVFDQLATIDAISAGQTIDLGDIGILGCWPPVPSSQIDLVSDFITAPTSAVKGGQIAVTSSFRNQGSAASGPFEVGVYFSTDTTIDTSDTFTGFICSVPGLPAGASDTCDGLVSVPNVVPGDYYVGLLADHTNQVGENTETNNGVAAANLMSVAPNPLDPIVNGSFETGDLTGWSVKELNPASNPSLPLSVDTAGVEYPAPTFLVCDFITYCFSLDYFTSAPTDGQYAALHDFNGDDPTTNGPNAFTNRRELYQDVTLPAGTTTLEFDYRAAWELFRFGSTQDRSFDVELEPAGGGATLLDQRILTAWNGGFEEDTDNPSGGSGSYPPGIVDLSAFAGQSVRLKFVWNIPEPGTGFGFFQLDNIRLNTAPNTAPAVTITAPADGATFTEGDSINFAATATDSEDGNLAANLSWTSSIDGAIGSGASFSIDTLSAGTHTITASVTDSGLANGSDAISITVDPFPNTPPVVTITAPADGSVHTQGDLISFTGTATDTEDGDLSANLSWSSSLDGIIGSGAGFSTDQLQAGTHTITASVTDSHGGNGSDSITITVNNTPPTVTITAPPDGSVYTEGDLVSITGTASDAQDGSLTNNLSWTSSLDGAIGSGGGFSLTTLSVGTHTITASVTDSGGLPGQASITLTINNGANTAPAVTITAPVDGSAFPEGTMVSFSGTATDTEDGNLAASLTWTSSINGVVGTGASFSTSALSAGIHTITASVTDSGGLPGQDSITVTINSGAPNTPPSVSITSPADGSSHMAGDSIDFAGAASDAEDGPLSAGLIWSSNLDGPIGTGAGFSTTSLSPGSHIVTASVTDSGGLGGSAQVTVNVDVNNPATADFSNARGTLDNGTSYLQTLVQDDIEEQLTEEQQGGNPNRSRSLLDHVWTFNVAPGANYVFKIDAFHSGNEDDFAFSYSLDNSTYTPMLVVNKTTRDNMEQTYVFDQDVAGTVYIRVEDTDHTQGNSTLDTLFVDYMTITTMAGGGGNTAPSVIIAAPADGATFTAGTPVNFSGSANDAEDGDIGANIVWTSNVDGPIGTGTAFSTSGLSTGPHTITASVTDSGGLPGMDSITITINPVGGGLVLDSATGYKVKGVQNVDLVWHGATTPNVDVYRNNAIVGTVMNTGAYTDNIGNKGSGSYVYRICEEGTAVCSNSLTVTF